MVMAQSKQVCRDGAGRTIGRSLSKSMKVRAARRCAVMAQTTKTKSGHAGAYCLGYLAF